VVNVLVFVAGPSLGETGKFCDQVPIRSALHVLVHSATVRHDHGELAHVMAHHPEKAGTANASQKESQVFWVSMSIN
jgi:hypothetical protein